MLSTADSQFEEPSREEDISSLNQELVISNGNLSCILLQGTLEKVPYEFCRYYSIFFIDQLRSQGFLTYAEKFRLIFLIFLLQRNRSALAKKP